MMFESTTPAQDIAFSIMMLIPMIFVGRVMIQNAKRIRHLRKLAKDRENGLTPETSARPGGPV